MKKITIEKNLYQYQFPPFEGQQFGFNIYALINGAEALLIDTAFECHAQQVVEDLKKENIEIKHVVFSHFHPDHISGLPALNKPSLYGSGVYQKTLDKYTPKEKHHYFEGMNTLDNDSSFRYGPFNLRFELIKGHVPCGMFTIINEQYIHVADDVMASNKGEPLLPSVHKKGAPNHIDSLDQLRKFTAYSLLLSHGNVITGEAKILDCIQQRQHYLRAIANNEQPISVDKALADCDCEFLHKDWHNYVYL